MLPKICLLSLLIMGVQGLILAQNDSKTDSIWLRNMIDGKEPFKINEDTKNVIEEGRLFFPPWIKNEGNMAIPLDSFKRSWMFTITEEERKLLISLSPKGGNFGHLLSMVFSPVYRRRAYNAKHATAYKNFNTGISFKMTEYERNELRKAVNNLKKIP